MSGSRSAIKVKYFSVFGSSGCAVFLSYIFDCIFLTFQSSTPGKLLDGVHHIVYETCTANTDDIVASNRAQPDPKSGPRPLVARWWKVWACILILLLIVGAIVWELSSPTSRPLTIQRPEDNSTITLRTKYGKELKIVNGKPWQRFLGPLLPTSIATRFKIRTTRYVASGTNSVFFVLETTRLKTFSAFPRAMPFTFGSQLVVDDNAGNAIFISSTGKFTQPTNTLVEVFVAPMVSHVSTQLTVHVIQHDFAQLTNNNFAFNLRNPAPRKAPLWNPGPLPMTSQVGDLTIVSRRCTFTRSRPWQWCARSSNLKSAARPVCR